MQRKLIIEEFRPLGGGWAWGVGIFSSLQGLLCVGALCALQCAKNSVGSGRQSHGCLYMCRMFNRVTYNVWRLQEVGDFGDENCLPPLNLIRSTKLHLTTEPPISCRCC